jgi:hypothetical protein
MQGCAAERSRPDRQSFAELLAARLVSLQNDFGVDNKCGLRVIAGQVAISLQSARVAFGLTTADAPPVVREGAVPPRLQEAEARRLQHAFGIKREFALRLLRERGLARLSTSAGRQVQTRTHRRLPVDYHCLEVQDAVEMQSREPGQPTRTSEFLARCSRKGALQTAWGLWCRWTAAEAKRAAAPRRRLECSHLRSNRVATSFKAWRVHRLSLTAVAHRRMCDTRQGERAMRWAWKHLVRSSVSRGLRIVPLQVAWRIWRATAVATVTKAGRRRRCQLNAALHAWQKSAAHTKAVLDRPLSLKLASRRTAFGAARDQARRLLLRRAWAQWMPHCVRLAEAEATLDTHALNKLKVSAPVTYPTVSPPVQNILLAPRLQVSKLRLAWSIWLHPQVRFAEDPLASGPHVFVKGVAARQLQLFTSLSTSADVVSQALAQRVHGPAPMLKYGGRYLKGRLSLSSYKIRSGDTIETSLGLRGGVDTEEEDEEDELVFPARADSTEVSSPAHQGTGDDRSLESPGGASGLAISDAESILAQVKAIESAGQAVDKKEIGYGYKVTFKPGAKGGARKYTSVKAPMAGQAFATNKSLREYLGLASTNSPRPLAGPSPPAAPAAPVAPAAPAAPVAPAAPAAPAAPVQPQLPVQPQSSFKTGVVILGDPALFQFGQTSDLQATPLMEASLGKFLAPGDSRLDCVLDLFATLKRGSERVDLVQLESEVASALCENGLLSLNLEEWQAGVTERREQTLEIDIAKNQLRTEQDNAELNEGEQERLDQKLKQLEATGKQREKERVAYRNNVSAYYKAAEAVTKNAQGVLENLPFTLPPLSEWKPNATSAFVVRVADKTAALAFLCDYSPDVPDVPDEPTSQQRTIRMHLKALRDDAYLWHTCDLLIDERASRSQVIEHVLAYLKGARHIQVADALKLTEANVTVVTEPEDSVEPFEVDVSVDPQGGKDDELEKDDEAPEACGPSPKQVEVAGRLLARMKRALALGLKCEPGQELSGFFDLKFIILVPALNTLQQQTADRVRGEGLVRLPSEDDMEPAGDVVIQ